MFGIEGINAKLKELENRILSLENAPKENIPNLIEARVNILKSSLTLKEELGCEIKSVREYVDKSVAKVEQSLLTLKEEEIDKYLLTIERLFQFCKDTAYLVAIFKSDSNMAFLKRDLLMPHVKEQWKNKEDREAKNIEDRGKSIGHIILEKKKSIEQAILQLEKQGKDVSCAKEQLEIIKMFTEAKNGITK